MFWHMQSCSSVVVPSSLEDLALGRTRYAWETLLASSYLVIEG